MKRSSKQTEYVVLLFKKKKKTSMWMSVSKGTPSKPKVKQLSMWLVEQLSKGIDLQIMHAEWSMDYGILLNPSLINQDFLGAWFDRL